MQQQVCRLGRIAISIQPPFRATSNPVTDPSDFRLAAVVAAPFILAIGAPALIRWGQSLAVWLVGGAIAALTAYALLSYFPHHGAISEWVYPWAPTVGISLTLRLDGLSLMFTGLIAGVGALIVLFAGAYLKGNPRLGYFVALILAFMGSMLGLVLAGDVLTLFVFWELTSVCSFLLIGFDNTRRRARRSALQALAVTGGGGLALLVGLIWLSQLAGSTELSSILAEGDRIRSHAAYVPVLVLVLLGAFTKSAQFPFHFWLPNAMEAPTPVSAYLHSATMVKAGVYLLARLYPALAGTELWSTVLVSFGGITFVLGAALALAKTDLKQILAQTTVSSLGLLVMLLGLGTDKAVKAAMTYLLAHALFKGALFMVAGGVDHEAGTRELTKLRGLRKTMPITATAAGLAAFSMAGLPPFAGFLAKEVAYAATLANGWSVTLLSVVGNTFMMGAALAAGIRPFFGEPSENAQKAHEGPVHLWLGAAILALLSLGAGLLAHLTGHWVLSPAASDVAGSPIEVDLHLWHGLSPPLFASLVTMTLGALVFWQLDRVQATIQAVLTRLPTFDAIYDRSLDWVIGAAQAISRFAHTQVLRYSMHVLAVLVAVAIAVTALSFGVNFPVPTFENADFQVGGIATLALASAFVIVFFSSRLNAILAMGVLGLAVALTFMLFGGPDLAFTQLMVETLSVVVLALVLTHLPVDGQDPRRLSRMIADAVLAVTIGAVTTLTLWAITAQPFDANLSDFYSKQSYVEAHGRNIVNVILVDFRAVDTLGEIMVVMSTGVAVLALLRSVRRSRSNA